MVPLPATRVFYGNHTYLYCYVAAKRGGRLVSACQACTPKCPRQKDVSAGIGDIFCLQKFGLSFTLFLYFTLHPIDTSQSICSSRCSRGVAVSHLVPCPDDLPVNRKPINFSQISPSDHEGKTVIPQTLFLGAPRPHIAHIAPPLPFLSCRRDSQIMPILIPILSHIHANTSSQPRIPVRFSTLR